MKEPARGALGRADDAVIRAIAAAVAGRRPVSAALGEWSEDARLLPDADLTFVKWGLAGCGRRPDWRRGLAELLGHEARPQVVLVAYADWECAQAPPIEEVFALACEYRGSVMLLDTHCKDANNVINKTRPTLLDWLPTAWVEDLCARCRDAKVRIALAGSLGLPEIRALRFALPDWFAVRGAVCADGDRQAAVEAAKVRELTEALRASTSATMSAS